MTMDDNMNVHVFADGNGVIIFNLTSKTDKARKRTIYIGIKAYYEGTDTVPTDNKDKNLYTVYNPNTEEYIFSTNPGEINYLISLGWINQGSRGWTIDGTESVYRLYNPNSGAHHYTKDYNEYSYLTSIGWNGEGEVFKSGGTFPTYRLYDAEQARRGNEPGTHKYTQNYEHLMKMIGFAGGPKGQYEYTYIGENCLRGELLPYPALSNEGIAWYTTPNLDFTDWDLW